MLGTEQEYLKESGAFFLFLKEHLIKPTLCLKDGQGKQTSMSQLTQIKLIRFDISGPH
jgi:hypothetical protein